MVHIRGLGGTEWGRWRLGFAFGLFFATASVCALLPGRRLDLILGAALLQSLVFLGPPTFAAVLGIYAGFYFLVRLPITWWLKSPALLLLLLSPYVVAMVRPGTRLLTVMLAALFTGNFLLRSVLYAYEATLQSRPERLAGLRGFLVYLLAPPLSAIKAEPVGFIALHNGLRRDLDLVLMRNGMKQVALGFLYLVLHEAGTRAGIFTSRATLLDTAGDLNLLTAVAACNIQVVRLFLSVGGHIHIAIGMMRVLGFDIAPGMNRPFASRNVLDYWKRWNTYYRDFLLTLAYYPALFALKRRPYLAVAVAGSLTFILSGFTHALYNAMENPLRSTWRGFLVSHEAFLAQGVLVVIWMVWSASRKLKPMGPVASAPPPSTGIGPRLFHFACIALTITVTGFIVIVFAPWHGFPDPASIRFAEAFLRPPWK